MGSDRNEFLQFGLDALSIEEPLASQVDAVWDAVLWSSVGGAGLVYLYNGVATSEFWENYRLCCFWGFMKVGVAGSLLQLKFSKAREGPYTLVFGALELVWAAGFFLFGALAYRNNRKVKKG